MEPSGVGLNGEFQGVDGIFESGDEQRRCGQVPAFGGQSSASGSWQRIGSRLGGLARRHETAIARSGW